jgi:hypothetical protein
MERAALCKFFGENKPLKNPFTNVNNKEQHNKNSPALAAIVISAL